jgi:hypothetical protein
MNRDDVLTCLRAGLIAVFVVLAATLAYAADPPRLPPGVSCADVRAKVAEHGKVYAYAWAKLQGYSRAEIEIAKRCLK